MALIKCPECGRKCSFTGSGGPVYENAQQKGYADS